jgi:hypothetical protein
MDVIREVSVVRPQNLKFKVQNLNFEFKFKQARILKFDSPGYTESTLEVSSQTDKSCISYELNKNPPLSLFNSIVLIAFYLIP